MTPHPDPTGSKLQRQIDQDRAPDLVDAASTVLPTEPGRYAVVRVYPTPEPEEDWTPPEREFVRIAGFGVADYWIQPDDAGAWSWEDVIEDALKVEVVRAGIETDALEPRLTADAVEVRLECLRLAANHAPPRMEGPAIAERAQRFIDLVEGKARHHEATAAEAKFARVEALHVPWYEVEGVRHDFTVISYGSDVPADHVCRIGVEHQQCIVYPGDPDSTEHQVLACSECRQACEDYDVGHPFWPCATAAALTGDAPTDHTDTEDGS